MSTSYVYDKAKYHYESIEEFGLPESHACNHTLPILRWFIENDLMSEFFKSECSDQLTAFMEGRLSALALYEWWDCCLISDMISDKGNAFGISYFDFEKGKYIADYKTTLQSNLSTEFHIEFTEESYQKLKLVIDRRYSNWMMPKKSWWKFWN